MDEINQALKDRYAHIHPLIFQRSMEKARSHGELFDILEDVPNAYPLVWDEIERRWKHTKNLLQADFIK